MPALSRRQLVVLALLTLVWGLNWPVMKMGVAHFPPLTFRMASLWLDTAGARPTAPALRLRFMPEAEARALHRRLAAELARMPLRW